VELSNFKVKNVQLQELRTTKYMASCKEQIITDVKSMKMGSPEEDFGHRHSLRSFDNVYCRHDSENYDRLRQIRIFIEPTVIVTTNLITQLWQPNYSDQ
jgi:hypothetical protein